MSILILTHGNLGHELLNASRTIAGELPDFAALCLEWDDSPEQAEDKVREAIARLREGNANGGRGEQGGVLILTDLYGSTPTNAALKFLDPGRVEVLTGVNLPMVMRLGCAHRRDMPVEELAHWLQKKGRESLCVASDRGARRPPADLAEHPCREDDG